MSDKASELLRKKEQLARIREEKRQKDQLGRSVASPAGTPNCSTLPVKSTNDLLDETESIMSGLVLPAPNISTSINHASGDSSFDTSLNRAKSKKLQTFQAQPISIEPREKNSYCKETQTIAPASHGEVNANGHDGKVSDYYVLNFEEDGGEIDTNATLEDLKKIGIMGNNQHEQSKSNEEEQIPVRELDDDEKTTIIQSDDFLKFFDRTSRIIERAVYEMPDTTELLFKDYTGFTDEEIGSAAANKAKLLLKSCRTFHWNQAPSAALNRNSAGTGHSQYSLNLMRQRTITGLDWSPIFPELLLASYVSINSVGGSSSSGTGAGTMGALSSISSDSLKDAESLVMIWNMKFKKETPEFYFFCQSAVTSCCFAPFHPNLVIGGTFSGQIVLWDNRSNKRTPVQRSSVSNHGHTHPVYSVSVQGTQHAHNLLSVSSDGLLCSWSLDNLSQPQERLELSFRQTKAVAATSMSFFSNDINNFIIGAQEAAIYTGCRHGDKAGILECFEGHTGSVTSVSSHPLAQSSTGGLGSLFLSSSMDWTVRLWSNSTTGTNSTSSQVNTTNSSLTAASTPGVSQTSVGANAHSSLHVFEHYTDYIFDCSWSPLHPAMFASCDGLGWLHLWNINDDYEVPVAKAQNENGRGYNKLRWSSSGLHIACGDVDGKVCVYEINEQLSTPHQDEVARLSSTINEIQQANIEVLIE